MSTDLHTLSGAFALNALSAEEAEQFRRHLDACQVCRQEIRELQQAAATMGASEALPPPTHLKARVLAAVDRTSQLPPRTGGGGAVTEIPRRSWAPRLLLAAAALALVVAGGIGIAQLQGDEKPDSLLAADVVEVFKAEDAHTAAMPTEIGGEIRVAASPKLNEMAVDTDGLPPPPKDHVYQLWAVHDGTMESVALLEPAKGAAMEMPTPDTEVAITVEPAGGSEQPTSEPIMQVNPSQI